MEHTDLAEIARQLCELLDRQMEIIRQHEFYDLTEAELNDYERRRARIAELRVELENFARPM